MLPSTEPHRCSVCQMVKPVVEDARLCVLCREETKQLLMQERDVEIDHKRSQSQVNAIFDLVDHPLLDSLDLDKDMLHSTKFLAIQFNKLKMLNLNIELNTIHAAVENLKYRIKYLNVEVELATESLDSKRQLLLEQKSALETKYADTLAHLDNNVEEYQQYNVQQIRRHLLKQRLQKYETLRQLVFYQPNTDVGSLLFYGQPIIGLGEFVTLNILVINNFLENLIRLQIQLQTLFAVDFPYLEGLRMYLPTSEFYDARQEKEDELRGDEEADHEKSSDRDTDPEQDGDPEVGGALVEAYSEKVLKLGDQIKLPLSSKTLNRQRRLSLIDQRNSSRGPSPQKDENANATTTTTTSVSRTASPVAANAPTNGSSRKMVIVPHRILRLPFSRLSIREFLKFLLVVSKIIINFDYFLLQVGNPPQSESVSYDMHALLEQVYGVNNCLQQQYDAVSSSGTPSAGTLEQQPSESSRLLANVDFHPVMEKLYELIIVESQADTKKGPPEILRNLNVRDFIISYKVKHDWDVIQK